MKAKLYKVIKDNYIQCTACKHYCVIKPNQTGICAIRGNENGVLMLYTYSYPAAIHLDPIEKKPLYHFYPKSLVYSIGTYGCNFRCAFCQNWQLSQFPKKESQRKSELAKKLIQNSSYYLPPEKAVEQAIKLKAQGMAYTYNEPVIWAEYAEDIAEIAKEKGLFNVFVSSGYETNEALDYLKAIDAYNIDLKGYSNAFYLRVCGTKLDNVLDTIKEVKKRGKWLELTTLIIPGENDEEEGLRFLAQFIKNELGKDTPWHLTRFHPDYLMLDKPITPLATLYKAYNIAKEEGLNFVYIGNVPNIPEINTYCPKCKELLIERTLFSTIKNHIQNNKCPNCKTTIPGVFG